MAITREWRNLQRSFIGEFLSGRGRGSETTALGRSSHWAWCAASFMWTRHGGSTALVGIALGGFPLTRKIQPIWAWLCGLAIATAYHMSYNFLAFQNLGEFGLPILIGAAFLGPVLVVVLILGGPASRTRRHASPAITRKMGVPKVRLA